MKTTKDSLAIFNDFYKTAAEAAQADGVTEVKNPSMGSVGTAQTQAINAGLPAGSGSSQAVVKAEDEIDALSTQNMSEPGDGGITGINYSTSTNPASEINNFSNGASLMATEKKAMARTMMLGNLIVNEIQKTAGAYSMEKAAAQAYQDVSDLVRGGMPANEAINLLYKIAEETPAAILPAEEMPEEVADAVIDSEGGEGEVDEVSAIAEELGVSPEELEQAVQIAGELEQAGVSPEEAEAAVEELAAEKVGHALPLHKRASASYPRVAEVKNYLSQFC